MATIVNDIDIILQATSPRLIDFKTNYIAIQASATSFSQSVTSVSNPNGLYPISITLTPKINGYINGTISWIVSPGTFTNYTVDNTTKVLTLLATNMNVAELTFTASITYAGITYTTSQKITKISESVTSTFTRVPILVNTDSNGNNGDFTNASTVMSVYIGNYDDSNNWTYNWTVPATVTVSGVTNTKTITISALSADNATLTVTASKSGWANHVRNIDIIKSKAGANATNIDAQLTNDFHTIPTAADGTGGVYTGASTTIEVYKNGVLQTSGFTFYVSGLQNVKYRGTGDTSDRTGTDVTNGALTATSGTAVVDIVELSADSGYVDITAKQTSDGQLFTKRFSLSRNKAGVIGNDAVIYEIRSNANAIVKASPDAATDGAHTPSSINFKIYQTVGNNLPALTGGARLYYIQWNSPATEPTANDTNAVLVPVTGLIPAVTIANNSDYTSVNIKLLYKNAPNNYTELDREEIGVVFKGDNGTDGKVVYSARVWLQTSSAPAAPTGGNFNASTGVLTAPSGWTITQPSVSTTPTYASEYTFVVDPGTTTNTGGTWSTPFIDSVQGSDGSAQERVELYLATSDGSTPTVPTSVLYTITGAVLGTVTGGTAGWSLTMPAVPANPGAVFMTTAVASSATPGTQITLGTWSTPVKVAQNGANGTSPVFIDLSNDNVSVATLANGTGGTYTSANTNVTLTSGTTDVLSSATISITPSTGVTYTYTRNGTATTGATTAANLTTGTTSLNVNITAISGQDSGTLTIVATYNSIAYTAVFTVSKAKAGSDGSPATVYEVEASGTFNINVNTNAITPASITYSAFSTTGTAARVAYSSGSIVTERSTDGSTWTTIATTNAATATLLSSSLLTATRFVRARLYTEPNGGGTLVDQESTALSVSGTDGTNGVSPKLLTATATTNAFVYDATGGSPSPANSTVTVTQQNITGTYYWTSTIGVTESSRTSSSSSTFTYNYTPQSLFVNMPQTITFKAYDASSGGNLLASTSVTMTASRVGAPGTGTSGASVFKAYTKTTNSSTVPAKAATTTSGAVPTSGGQTWYTDPGSIPALTGSEAQWEVDGTQPAGSTTTTWGTPYLSYFKVAQLSAIAADMGTITAGTIQSLSGSAAVYITPDGMKVYDTGGILRVRIGNLSNW